MSTKNLQDRLASLTPAQRAILERRLQQRRESEASQQAVTAQPAVDETPAPEAAPRRQSLRERWAASKNRQASEPGAATSGPQARPPSADELGPNGEIFAPLSLMQERIWVLDQIAPGNPAFNLPILAYRLEGRLRTADLQHALTVAETRHECLRTTFRNVEGDGLQVIHPPRRRTPMPLIDLRRLSKDDRERTWEDVSVTGGRAAYDLQRGPLWRPIVLCVGDEDHVMVLLMHHIVSDGWSMAVLFNDLHAVYSGTLPEALPTPRYHYRDFSRWQQEQKNAGVLDADLAYWKQHLDGAPLVLELPTDRPRPARQTFDGYRWFETFPDGLWERMVAAHGAAGTTAFVYLLALWNLLLYRLSGQRDVLTGCPMAGRHQAGTEALVGFFVNTLVLRASVDPAMPFHAFLSQMHDRVLEGFDHRDLPFHMLVQGIQGHRDPAYPPVFQTMFNFQNIPMPDMKLGDLPVDQGDVQDFTSQVDLILYTGFDETRNCGFAFLEFNSDLFDLTTIGRWHHHLVHLLEGVLADPSTPVGELQLLGPGQRQQLLIEWPDRVGAGEAELGGHPQGCVPTQKPPSDLLHRVLDPWLAATPDAIALVAPPYQLSYGELWRRAASLAQTLRSRGVRPDDVVAVQLPRRLELPVSLLAILQAGGAYLVLDPAQPAGRRRQLLEDSGARLLLTGAAADLTAEDFTAEDFTAEDFTVPAGVEVLHLVLPGALAEGNTPEAPDAQGTPDAQENPAPENLAYLIYTSGSTGTPKGVLLQHAHAVRMLRASRPWLHTRPGDTWALLHSYAFDFSVWELWATLSRGGRGLLVPGHVTRAPQTLHQWLAREAVAVLHQTPTAFPQLDAVDAAGGPQLGALHSVLFGGEALPLERLRGWAERYPSVALHNLYGPTEVTVYGTQRRLHPADQRRDGIAPLGHSIVGVPAYVTDPRGGLVSAGVHGELRIGGSHLARGYLDRPALTAERFVPDSFSALLSPAEVRIPGGHRLYRTGDLVRRDATGELHFLGRVDQQVKLRGFRIELGEIEARLGQHPGVTACALLLEGEGDAARLTAYLVIAKDGTPAASAPENSGPEDSELRGFLADDLPAYMLPSRYVRVEQLPRTAGGKVDRKALARLAQDADEAAPRSGSDKCLAPRDETEERLAQLWAEALQLSQISVDADFFELGGHSLLATRLAARIQKAFDIDLPVQALFEAPTIALLVPRLRAAAGRDTPRLPPLEPLPRGKYGSLLNSAAPTSFTQRRLWFLERLVPDNPFYVVPVAWELRGPLQHAAMARAFVALVARHETLRTVFVVHDGVVLDGEPVQRILEPSRRRPLPVVDLASLGELAEAEARRLGSAEAGRPFQLDSEPQLRTSLLRLTAQRHVLLLSLHHITSDGWSLGILGRDLDALVRQETAALHPGGHPQGDAPTTETEPDLGPDRLPTLPIQYADYAAWQRSWLQGDLLAAQLDWWRGQLVGDNGRPPQLDLPTDRPRPAVARFRGAQLTFALPPGLLPRVERLTAREVSGSGTTLFMVLLAGFATLLGRASDQRDMILGSPVAGRQRTEVEDLIGVFINTLALRCRLTNDSNDGNDGETLTFRQLLARLRTGVLGAFAHQDLPFERLVEALAPERDLSRNPLFQISFALQNAPEPGGRLGELELAGFPVELHSTHFDLEVHLRPAAATETTEATLIGAASYDPDLYDRTTILRLCRHLGRLLDAAAAAPDVPVDMLPLLDATERHQLLLATNDTAIPAPRQGLAARFATVAAQRPDAVAAVYGRRHLSYGELARRASRLAGALALRSSQETPSLHPGHPQGGAPTSGSEGPGGGAPRRENVIGLQLPAGVDLVVGMLATLYAGGAYLPIDPELPEARRDWLRTDSGAQLVIDDLDAFLATAPAAAATPAQPSALADGSRLAYVLYTSGSTGRPKGVAVPQRAVLRLVLGHDTAAPNFQKFGPGDRLAQAATPSFDAATYEFWGALLHGGTVVGLTRDTLLSPSRLARHLRRQRVTGMFLAATVFQRIVAVQPDAFAPLDHLHVGGEAPPLDAVRRVLESLAPPEYLGNGYGPTENTTFTTWAELTLASTARGIPLGRPLLGSCVHLLDRRLRLVPLGAPGELCTGGDGLARGYLGRPALTAEKFVPDPHAVASGRLYRTGDLARRRADGTLEFLGRRDRQVKIRGFRVEPGEVAAVLGEHASVERAAVIARPGASGDLRLLAYVVPTNDSVEPAELRTWLRGRLPEYLVPAALVLLDALPLTANGKLDHRALPEPDGEANASTSSTAPVPTLEARAPRDAFEAALLDIWRELLGATREQDPDADFFELGGHSLLATQVMSRLRQLFGVDLPLRTLFENPTPAALAVEVAKALDVEHGTRAAELPLVPRSRTENRPEQGAPLSFGQQRLWFLEQMGAAGPAYHLPAFAELRGALQVRTLTTAIARILQRHEVLRSGYRGRPDVAEQVVLPLPVRPERWSLPTLDLSALPNAVRDAELQRLTQAEFLRPFQLATPTLASHRTPYGPGETPVLRAMLVRLSPQRGSDDRHALLINVHHIAFDGWSLGILFREMAEGYRQTRGGEGDHSGSPRQQTQSKQLRHLQYADYAAWQQQVFDAEALATGLDAWVKELDGAPTLLALPTDRLRGEVANDVRAGRLPWHLDGELSARLRNLSRDHGCTLFMTLVAVLQLLLGRLSGQDRVLIGSPIAGRTRRETEELIGFFINPLVLHGDLRRTDADASLRFTELLQRTRRIVLAAYGRQDVPFEQVIQALKPEPSLNHTPLFQVSLNLLNLPSAPLKLPDLTLELLDFGEATAKFDLNFYVRERPESDSGGSRAPGIDIELHYRRALFQESRIRGLLQAFEALLRGVCQAPAADARHLPLFAAGVTYEAWLEPAAVERRLQDHPAVQAAAVVACRDADGELQWTACAVASPPPFVGMQVRLDTGVLLRWIGEALPLAALPGLRVLQVDELPGSQGLVDRVELQRQLAARLAGASTGTSIGGTRKTSFVAPRNPLEQSLAEIWKELLYRPGDDSAIGAHDDFFLLGGHSVLAVRLQAAVLDRLGVELPLRTLFEDPTLEALARRIEELRPALGSHLPNATAADSGDDLQQLLTEIEQLSDDEVDERLHRPDT